MFQDLGAAMLKARSPSLSLDRGKKRSKFDADLRTVDRVDNVETGLNLLTVLYCLALFTNYGLPPPGVLRSVMFVGWLVHWCVCVCMFISVCRIIIIITVNVLEIIIIINKSKIVL